MEYELVATLGPSTNAPAAWRSLLSAGATTFRINTSHLSVAQLRGWLDRLDACFSPAGAPPPVVLDLQGSKWRLGTFPPFRLLAGQRVQLVCSAAVDQPDILPVPHPDFFTAARSSSGEINLNDAKVRLSLEAVAASGLSARVIQGGEVSSHKGITFTASEYRQESLQDKDQVILESTRRLPFIRYALSYVKDAAEMASYRALIGSSAYLIAKLERVPAVSEAPQIAALANELWLCRGDLGAELGPQGMAETVYRFSSTIRVLTRPVLLAGQLFEHLVRESTPTRSEVCYLYEILVKGYRGIVLSDETAIGLYPLESCRAAAMFNNGTGSAPISRRIPQKDLEEKDEQPQS